MIVGFGLMSTIIATDSIGKSIGYMMLLGCGIGYVAFLGRGLSQSDALDLFRGRLLSATPMYPIQASLPVTQNATSMTFMWFIRSFASVSALAPLS